MKTRRRLQALERVVIPPDDRCGACGYAPGSELELKVSLGDEPDEGPDACPECGRPLIIRLSFDSPPGVAGP